MSLDSEEIGGYGAERYHRYTCPGCGNAGNIVDDGWCARCSAAKPERTDVEKWARAMAERLILTLAHPRASVQTVYRTAVWAAHAARTVQRKREWKEPKL